ncbi:MAG: mechanosensitive ion channel family protein, partial [Myxococcales bacterium]
MSHVLLPWATDLPTICQDTDSLTCKYVWNWTGNEALAQASAWLIGKPAAILGLLLLGLLVRWLVHRLIDRVVKRAESGVMPTRLGNQQRAGDTPGIAASRRVARAQGLGSLLKSITTCVVFGIVIVMMLDQIGLNVAPILASAGVLGLAIGFGAQSLVKDFLAGVFMMVEDQYGVGDSVNLGEASGTVEAVGLRVTRLRDVDGTVWYVRNGEILRVGNQSQNWARSVLDVSVGYGENLSRVRAVLKDVAHELWEDPAYTGVV